MKKRKIVFYTFISSVVVLSAFSCNGIASKDITIKGSDAIEIGETMSIDAEVLPKETTDKKINWSSSNNDIAFVDSEGNVTGIKPGIVTITATSNSNSSVNKSLKINIGNYIGTHVKELKFNPTKSSLTEGEYGSMNPIFTPSNADNKKIKWSTSDSNIVSVYDTGIIKAECEGKATIKGITEDGHIEASQEITVTSSTDKKTLIGFREPDCIANYNLKVKEADDKIVEKDINRNNSANYINGNFYKNDENKLDTYKVGNKNEFKINCIASWGNEGWTDRTEYNPWQEVTVTQSGTPVASGISFNKKHTSIKFDNTGVYKIEIKPDSNKYEYDPSNPEFTKSFEIEVVDGYNVYDFAGLTTVDNWSTKHAKEILKESHSIFQSNEFVDCWAEYKKDHGIDPEANYQNVILQKDISIDNKDLPKYISWTEKETDDYINGVKEAETKERFDEYVEIKSNIHQDDWKELSYEARRAKCRYLLNGSQKDCTGIFNRIGKEPFKLEGNYFTIDASKIKPTAMFEQTTLDYYQKNATHEANLFDFGGYGDYHFKYHTCTKQGGITEPLFDEFRPYTPPEYFFDNQSEIKNVQIHGNSTRNVTHDEGMGGFSAIMATSKSTFTNMLCHECSNVFYGLGINEKSVINIERCKLFDSFSSFICTFSQRAVNIKDSFFKDSGGVGITLTENVNESSHYSTALDIKNTYMEAFVSGNEIYNQNTIGGPFIKLLAALGLGAWEQYKDMNFNNKCDHRSIVKVEDDVPKVNLLIFHKYAPALQSIDAGLTTIKGNNNEDVIKLRDNEDMEIYNNMDLTSRTFASLPIQSSAGGHARIPIRQVAEGNDLELYDENIPYTTSEHQTYLLSEYKNNKASIDQSTPSYAKNAAKLFSGDYLTVYYSLLANYMAGIVLGYK